MNTEDYRKKYLKEEWVTENPKNDFQTLKTEFIPHFFSFQHDCEQEAKIASKHLSGGHYYVFEPQEGIFTWVRSDVLGRVSGDEMRKIHELARDIY